jgi:hypothetical protein
MTTKYLMTDFEIADGFDRSFLLWRAIDYERSYVSGSIADKNGIVTCHSQYFATAILWEIQSIMIITWKGEYLSKLPDALFQEEMIPLVT